MKKKGAELSLNVIIIAVIVLIVLAVILFIFSGKMNIFTKSIKECSSLGGSCSGEVTGQISDKVTSISCTSGTAVYGTNCETNNPMKGCCITLS